MKNNNFLSTTSYVRVINYIFYLLIIILSISSSLYQNSSLVLKRTKLGSNALFSSLAKSIPIIFPALGTNYLRDHRSYIYFGTF